MAAVKVRVNTFFQANQARFIDSISKYLIIAESLMGQNRLPILLKGQSYFYILSALAFAYSLTILSGAIYFSYQLDGLFFILYSYYIEYAFCVTFSFITWKRTDKYYNEINKFDAEIGCRPKITREIKQHFIFLFIFTGVDTIFYRFQVMFVFTPTDYNIVYLTPLNIIHCLEIFYYGHLLSLLAGRLRLINYYMESSLLKGQLAKRPEIEEFLSFKNKNSKNTDIKKLMDLYQILIKSYDLFLDAIKWQLLVILITTFIRTLTICYDLAMDIMYDKSTIALAASSLAMLCFQMLPLFSPCVFGDRVHNEVKRLRELLASRLYENKLDKSGRSTARALLGLTEARDLSFSLLRMLEVDVSLPFKFIGLLVTYLIILLQFDKVIHPARFGTNNGTN